MRDGKEDPVKLVKQCEAYNKKHEEDEGKQGREFTDVLKDEAIKSMEKRMVKGEIEYSYPGAKSR